MHWHGDGHLLACKKGRGGMGPRCGKEKDWCVVPNMLLLISLSTTRDARSLLAAPAAFRASRNVKSIRESGWFEAHI